MSAVAWTLGVMIGFLAGAGFAVFAAKHGYVYRVASWYGKEEQAFMAWKVKLRCPQCGATFDGQAEWHRGHPFPLYIAECPECHHVITESEWNEV